MSYNPFRTLIGIVTFGNANFTRLAVQEIRKTVKEPYELLLVIGLPGDLDTLALANEMQVPFVTHHQNKGFPASINDLYQTVDTEGQHNLIVMGNDVVPYPGAIDNMIRLANQSEWEWICSSQFDARSLCDRYPEARQFFSGPSLVFSAFDQRPWDLHLPAFEKEMETRIHDIEVDCIKDVRNLCLFKRSVFDKIGFADVNFWPGGYFEDNDYCHRALLAGVKACGLPRSAYFHFWSRTIHQGTGKSANDFYFARNSEFYRTKWGGGFGEEKYALPFDGKPHVLESGVQLEPQINIQSRTLERFIIDHWRKMRA